MNSRFVRFSSTVWTVIHKAGDKGHTAYGDFIHLYRTPVTRYLRNKGVDEQVAEDLAQEVFLRLFEKELLKKVEKTKGRFRSYLLGVANNILREHLERKSAKKRGGGQSAVSIEALEFDLPKKDERDFTKEWMLHLVRLALTRITKSGSKAAARDMQIFRAFLWDRQNYEALGKRFEVSFSKVKNAIHATKGRIRAEVAKLVNNYTYSQREFHAEMTVFDEQALKFSGA